MANQDNELQAGFTGTPVAKSDGLAEKAKTAVAGLKNEADAVSAAVADHPHTATTLLVTVSALAFGLGYVLGHASGAASRPRLWR